MRRALYLSLLVSIAACGPDPTGSTSEPSTDAVLADDGIDNASTDGTLGDALGLELEERDGWGPFYIRTSPLAETAYPPAEDFPSSEWACDAKQVFSDDQQTAIVWTGCRVDHLDRLADADAYAGDFDVAASFVRTGTDAVDLTMWVDNRLSVGLDRFRYVMRVATESLPDDTTDMRALFGYDDFIEDPLTNLRKQRDDVAWMNQVAIREGERDRYFVRNRIKISSMMSIHTPDWGMVMHGTDADNADPGWLLLGSNPDDDGNLSLEVGYEYKLEGEYVAGNGTSQPMQMGPALRSKKLAAERPLDTAWWEAVDAYIPFLENESNLLPGFELKQAAYPAQWAQDCLFAAWNVGPPENADEPYDLSHFLDEFRAVAAHYASPDGERLVFCPLLWDFHTYAPHVPRPAAVQLLSDLQALAAELEVEFHPGAYYLPWAADAARLVGHPLQDAVVYKANGEPHGVGDGTVLVAQDHPELIADVLNVLDLEYDLGIHWAYHDNPFREMVGWRPWAESKRSYHVNTRNLIQLMADRLTENGGGLVTIEQGRLGLNTMQAGAAGITGSLIPGGQASSFGDALFHGRHLTAFAGDIVGESLNIVYGDKRATPVICATVEDPNNCPYTGGSDDNLDHMPRLAMTAALGRSLIDPMPDLRGELTKPTTPAIMKVAFANYLTAMRNAYWLRRHTPALRTGRLIPTPPSNAGKVTFSSRPILSVDPPKWENEARVRIADAFPAGFFEDKETNGRHVLVVGNPSATETHTVVYTLDAADYPDLMGAMVQGASVEIAPDGSSMTLEVQIPPLGFAVVNLDR